MINDHLRKYYDRLTQIRTKANSVSPSSAAYISARCAMRMEELSQRFWGRGIPMPTRYDAAYNRLYDAQITYGIRARDE